MKKTFLGVMLFAVVLLLFGCGGQATTTDEGPLVLDSIGVERQDSLVSVSYQVFYPVSGPAVLVDSLRAFIARQLNSTDSAAAEGRTFLEATADKDFADLRKEYNDVADGDWRPDAFNRTFEVKKMAETGKYVTMYMNTYEYMGGAHGLYTHHGFTFSKADGRQLGWNMLRDIDTPAFRSLLKEGLRQYFSDIVGNVNTDEALKELLIGVEDIKNVPLPASEPYLAEDGMHFCYQLYEVTSYAMGMPQIVIDMKTIAPYLADGMADFIDE